MFALLDALRSVLVVGALPDYRPGRLRFLWTRRQTLALEAGIEVQIPALEDLILTKRFANRPRDLEDIRLLTILKDGSA